MRKIMCKTGKNCQPRRRRPTSFSCSNSLLSVRVQQPHTAQKLTILIQNYYKVFQNLLCLQKLHYA
jgi:hypothetical protein